MIFSCWKRVSILTVYSFLQKLRLKHLDECILVLRPKQNVSCYYLRKIATLFDHERIPAVLSFWLFFQDILSYLDSSSESKNVQKICENTPPPPTRHHFFLMETEAELDKLTKTMKAFQKQPQPPPRQVCFLHQLIPGVLLKIKCGHASIKLVLFYIS